MTHARIGIYNLLDREGDLYQQAKGTLLKEYKWHPGFIDYELIESGDNVISISHWDTQGEADEAMRLTAQWVKENIATHVSFVNGYVGEVEMSSRG